MAISYVGTITMSMQDLANLTGVSVATLVAAAPTGAGILASQTAATFNASGILGGTTSPFLGMGVGYTTGATVGANDTITLLLLTGNRSAFNAKRLVNTISNIRNFYSAGFLGNTAPNGRVDITL